MKQNRSPFSTFRFPLSAILLALMATGCSVYHPQAVDVPLINHKGDLKIDGSLGLSSFVIPDVFTMNGTVSYGATDHLALQAHANYGGDNAYAQAAAGWYMPSAGHFVSEAYVGYGIGAAWREGDRGDYHNDTDNENYDTYKFNGHYSLPFVQLNVGWHDLAGSHLELGFGFKAGAFLPDYTYKRFDSHGVELTNHRTHLSDASLLIEPQFMIRFGGERVKPSIRIGLAFLSPDLGDNFIHDYLTVSAGLTFSL